MSAPVARPRGHRGSLGWGGFFIGVGLVPLAVAVGAAPAPAIDDLADLWPALLIVIGLGMILRRTSVGPAAGLLGGLVVGLVLGAFLAGGRVGPGCALGPAAGPGPSTDVGSAASGTFQGSTATVSLDVACGDLAVRSVPGQGWSLDGVDARSGATVQSDDARLHVTVPASGHGPIGRQPISADLPAGPQLDVASTERFGSLEADLSGARLGRVTVQTAFSSLSLDLATASLAGPLELHSSFGSGTVALPSAAVRGTIDNAFGSLRICLPAGTAARLTTHASFGSVDVADGLGLVRTGDVWQSADLGEATNPIDLELRTSFGSIDVTAGGC